MEKRSNNRIFAMLLALVLVVSTLSVDVMESAAAENYNITGFDGADVNEDSPDYIAAEDFVGGTSDGSDMGSSDGTDVSGNSQQVQEKAFLVTDDAGETIGNYDNWDDLLSDFKIKGDAAKEYVISVLPEAVIGKTMPSQTAGITLQAADKETDTLYFVSSTFHMAAPLVVEAGALCVVDSDKTVNINTKGKALLLNNTKKIGTVKGTSKGTLMIIGDVKLQGNLQSFKTLTVAGSLHVSGNVSSITNLVLDSGIVYLEEGKKFTVSNVDVTAGGALGFPAGGKLPTAQISGRVSGVLALKQFEELDGNYIEHEFVAGSKLLTASKATVEQFSLTGEGQLCYKKGSVLYVGAEVLRLYKEDEHLGTYAQWNDLKTKINNLKDKTASYRVVLLDDYQVNGTLAMPTKGRYAGLVFQNGKGSPVSLRATGNLTLTADVMLEPGITLEAKQVSGTSWSLRLGENSLLAATGNITVKNLVMAKGAGVQTKGKLTVKATLEAAGDNELVLTYKKAAAIKDTAATERIAVKLVDKSGNRVTATQNTTIFSVKGNSYATQYCLLDALEQEQPLYRKGNNLKVQGTVATPITLYYIGETGETNLGEYATLADVKSEISRRKIKQSIYRVDVGEKIVVKGSLPLPKAGTYESISFTGERIQFTGNMTLTGDVTFYNEFQRIKSELDVTSLPLTINLAKYTLTIPQGSVVEKLANVTGSTGSCLTIEAGVQQTIDGNLKAETLKLDGILRVDGDIAVTDIYPGAGNRLDYDLTETVTVKGNVYGTANKLVLNPMRKGVASTYTEGMKVLGNAPKVVISGLAMAQETDWVFYRDGNVVRLGKPLLTVFENTQDYEKVQGAESAGHVRFARINDAIEYINASENTDFVVRLDENIPSAGTFKALGKNKNLVLCGAAGERKTLKLTGSIALDGSSLYVRNIALDNSTTAGPGFILKNKASLRLYHVNVNTVTAPAGTTVTLEGEIGVKGAVTGACDMIVLQDTIIRAGNNITVNTLTLDGEAEGTVQLHFQTGKKLTANSTITTPEKGRFIINQVDKNDVLAGIGKDTVMAVAPYGQSAQFKTQNIMPGTFLEWSLIKKGNNIQTSEASQGDGEWSGDFL